jgi:ABC-type glycerol-3-phosphate transport system substrate-binding protein
MKKIILSTATVVLSVFLASCSNKTAVDDSSTDSSSSVETVESSSESKLDHAVALFEEFEEKYPELKSYKFNSYPNLWKEGNKVKTYATYKSNYDMNSSHYIIFEADGDEGSNKFYVDANKVYMETHMQEGDQVVVYGTASNYYAKYVNKEHLPELDLDKIYVDK